jgi:hypothetical protein
MFDIKFTNKFHLLLDPKAFFQSFSPALKSATAKTAKEDRINGKLETTLHCGAFCEADKDKLSAISCTKISQVNVT